VRRQRRFAHDDFRESVVSAGPRRVADAPGRGAAG